MPARQELIDQIENLTIIPNSLALWGLGQMGLLIKGPDALIAIDPYLSDSVREMTQEQYGSLMSRAFPAPLQPEDLARADYILATHEHADHLDVQTLVPPMEKSSRTRIVTTGWGVESLTERDINRERLIVPEAFQPMTLPGTDIRLTAVPSAHYEKEYDTQKGYRWLGYLLEWNGVTLYHAGDTVLYEGYMDTMRDLPLPDVAMLPMNGRDWFRENILNLTGTLLPVEAVLTARELGWGTLIVGHNDMFMPNTIPNAQIMDALERLAPRLRFKFLQPGELYYFVK